MTKRKISAKIIADSISPQGNRITSFILTYPRFIHAEVMTHRMFSRNSASSRAIPFAKMVKMVQEEPFIPIVWQKTHKGMQGTEYWTDNDTVTVDEGDEYERYTKIYSATEHFITEWLEARDLAIAQSYELNRLGVTKQLCNRLLEPFMWHTVLVTATEWENFFSLRCPLYVWEEPSGNPHVYKSKKDALRDIQERGYDVTNLLNQSNIEWMKMNQSQAEIHIQALAEAMWDAMNESTPKHLESGQWHIPNLGHKWDNTKLYELSDYKMGDDMHVIDKAIEQTKIKIATAHCAKISYDNFGTKVDYKADIKLHDTLLELQHASAFEHCCRVLTEEEYNILGKMVLHPENKYVFENGWVDNFKGFISYRRILNI